MLQREHAEEEIADWVKAHRALLEVAAERCALEAREGKVLLWARRAGVHVRLGYGSFVEYVERIFGYAARTTLDKLRTAEALESLPELDRALAFGEASWSAVRELARVATVDTECEWLEASRGRTVREIERLVAGHEPGDKPSDTAQPLAERHVLRFEVAPETLATFREAMQKLRQQSGGHVEDDAGLLLMARQILESPDVAGNAAVSTTSHDAGRARYQLSLTLCERCRRGFQEANGERLEVDAAVIDMARCDAQHIGHVGGTALAHIEHMIEVQVGTPIQAHVGTAVSHSASQRATQTIPPALRRRILCRDAGRCVVPGCRHATFVDVHHVVPRSAGGRHDEDNLIVLCGAHHRAVHRGRLTINGRVSTGLRFQHADGSPYGDVPLSNTVGNAPTLAKVFRALCGLGFKSREARQALDAVMSGQAGVTLPPMPTAEELLRAALWILAPRAARGG